MIPEQGFSVSGEYKETGTMAVIDMVQTGKNIEREMRERRLTPKDMQNACGLGTVGTVYTWIRGKKMPNLDNMIVLAEMFGVTLDDLIAVVHV